MQAHTALVDEPKLANASALAHFHAFATHRARLTGHVRASSAPGGTLCILGAGNVCIRRHAPFELSGLVDKLDRWCALQSGPNELLDYPKWLSTGVAAALPGPFDVVVSACLLTQLQLAVLAVLSPTHRSFEAVRQVANLGHLRTLAELVAPRGRVVLASDVTSNATAPLDGLDETADLRPLLARLVNEGNVIDASNPDLLAWMVRQDPYLNATVAWSAPHDAWLWHNGPATTFLVYACEMRRRT